MFWRMSGGPLWPGKPGSRIGGMKSEEKSTGFESVKVGARDGSDSQEWRAL